MEGEREGVVVVLPKRLKLPTQLVSYQRLIKNFVQLPKVPKDSNKHTGATLATGGNAGNAGGGCKVLSFRKISTKS